MPNSDSNRCHRDAVNRDHGSCVEICRGRADEPETPGRCSGRHLPRDHPEMKWFRRRQVGSSGGPHGRSPSCSDGSKPPLLPNPPPGEGDAGLEALVAVAADCRGGWPGRRPRRATDGWQSTPRSGRPGCGGCCSRPGPGAGSIPRSVEIRYRDGSPSWNAAGMGRPREATLRDRSRTVARKCPPLHGRWVFFARRRRSGTWVGRARRKDTRISSTPRRTSSRADAARLTLRAGRQGRKDS
jgi:hypothetical protein